MYYNSNPLLSNLTKRDPALFDITVLCVRDSQCLWICKHCRGHFKADAVLLQVGCCFSGIPLDVKTHAYFTAIPGCAPSSGVSKKMSLPPGPAASTMPSLMPNFILRGARLATMTVRRPTSTCGSG